MNKKVGRPKTIDRKNIIDVAFNGYWARGINNVSISEISRIAKVSRPGIYKEFINEDGLKAEVLKKYIAERAEPAHKNYDDYKKHPNHLANHLNALINDGSVVLSDDSNYNNIKRPKDAIGCLLLRAILNKFTLGPVTQKVLNDFEEYRVKQFEKYIINAQNDSIMAKSLDCNFYAKYLHWIFGLIQIMRLNGNSKNHVENVINTSLIPLYQQKEILNS